MARWCIVGFLVVALAGCEDINDTEIGELGSQNQAERWFGDDDPTRAGDDLVYTLSELPRQGETSVMPWPGSSWETAKDAFNQKWAGSNTASL